MAAAGASEGESTMSLADKRAIVLVDQLYQELEVWYPAYRLREEGVAVAFIGPDKAATYPSKFGYPVVSDRAAAELTARDFDCLVIPGGYAPDHMRRHPDMVRLVVEAMQQSKIVGAICHAGWMLCSANCLRGRTVTSFFAIKDDMINAGAEWTDREVVRDRNLITSRKPDDLPAFMKTILQALRENS
jgi:protease I